MESLTYGVAALMQRDMLVFALGLGIGLGLGALSGGAWWMWAIGVGLVVGVVRVVNRD